MTRILDRVTLVRGLPKVLRTDNAQEFCGRAMLDWAYARGVALGLIEPGKPTQNASLIRDDALDDVDGALVVFPADGRLIRL